MVYTVGPLKTKSTAGGNNFGGLRVDGNRIALATTANTFQTIDATGTPLVSPLTVTTTATLVVPQNAYRVTIISVTNPVQISEDSTQSAFFALPAGIAWSIECANQQNVYLKVASSTVVSFMFECI